jgi:hypothetical protein
MRTAYEKVLMGALGGGLKWTGYWRYQLDSDTITFTHIHTDKNGDWVEKQVAFKLQIVDESERVLSDDEFETLITGNGYEQ